MRYSYWRLVNKLVLILFAHYFMAKKSVIARSQKKPKFSSRQKNRCFRCGRGNGYMRDFGLCRICFRELANEGMLPGVRKSSW
jgi:small subunit ribosomal protein S14